MKKTILFIQSIFICMLFSTAFSAPRMTLSESAFNFGYAPQHSKISHEFWIYSTGDDSLKIINVVPGCSCTKAPLEKKDIAVGDSTKIEIIFSTKSYKSHITKRPKIETNEGQPDKRIQILTNVVSRPDSTFPLVMQPYKLDISQFGEKLRDEIEFKIINVSDQPLELSMVAYPKELFHVILPASVQAGQTITCSLKLNKDAKESEFEKSFTIETSDEDHSRFTIPVKRALRDATTANATGH